MVVGVVVSLFSFFFSFFVFFFSFGPMGPPSLAHHGRGVQDASNGNR